MTRTVNKRYVSQKSIITLREEGEGERKIGRRGGKRRGRRKRRERRGERGTRQAGGEEGDKRSKRKNMKLNIQITLFCIISNRFVPDLTTWPCALHDVRSRATV